MAKIVSSLFDNDINKQDVVQDRYYGDVPMYLVAIPEAKIYECNPEYIGLIEAMVRGELNKKNISPSLWQELEYVIEYSACYGQVPMPTLDPLFQCLNITAGTLEPVILLTRPGGGWSTFFVKDAYGKSVPFVIKI